MYGLVIAAGGTGGHLFPGLCIAKAWLERYTEGAVYLIALEKDTQWAKSMNLNCQFYQVRMKGVVGRGIKGLMGLFIYLPKAFLDVFVFLWEKKPLAVLCFGGYISFPVGVMTRLQGIPLFIHESNAKPGLANRLLRRLANRVFVAHNVLVDKWGKSKTLLIGSPVRPEIEKTFFSKGSHKANKPRRILLLGGSQGALALNRIFLSSLNQLFKFDDFEAIVQWGKWPIDEAIEAGLKYKEKLLILPFIEDMAEVYRWADIIIARSGASTLAELAFVSKPTILVPFPYSSHNHQTVNASVLEKSGAALVLRQETLTSQKLLDTLLSLVNDKERLDSMAKAWKKFAMPGAANNIVNIITKFALKS